jgi:phosphoglycolate phosphatase
VKFLVDLDGTLLDSRRRVFQLFCDLSGRDMTFEQYWAAKREGKSNKALLTDAGFDQAHLETFHRRWMGTIESPDYLMLDHGFPFATDALARLARVGEILVITSRQNAKLARKQAEDAGFLPYIRDVLVTGLGVSKIQLCRDLKVSVEDDDVFVGDTGAEIAAARAFGAFSVAVLSGFRSRVYLARLAPDAIADDIGSYSMAVAATASPKLSSHLAR